MPKGNDCPKCLEKINALIANKDSKFDEADREMLLTQDEATLDKFAPVIVEKEVEKIVEKEVEVNRLSDEQKAALAYGEKQLKARKDTMIKTIQDNTEKGTWDEATLTAMSEDMLERVYKMIPKKEEEVDYSLNGNTFQSNRGDCDIDVELPVDVVANADKK